jgi:cobyrinic acid a,c-diamide synthase
MLSGVRKENHKKIIGSSLRPGYREVEFFDRKTLGKKGDRARGHEVLLHSVENKDEIHEVIASVVKERIVG